MTNNIHSDLFGNNDLSDQFKKDYWKSLGKFIEDQTGSKPTEEEKIEFHNAAAEAQKQLVFNEPWSMLQYDEETRQRMISKFSSEELADMESRLNNFDEYKKHYKQSQEFAKYKVRTKKKKGFG